MHPNLQVRATEVVAAITRKLADPHHVAATTDTAKNMMRLPSGPRRIWRPLALSDGHPGLALLFGGLPLTIRTIVGAHMSSFRHA
jgi:hypothetical protein